MVGYPETEVRPWVGEEFYVPKVVRAVCRGRDYHCSSVVGKSV